MSKTQIFIEKARAKHGDRYGYERSIYVHSRDKVIITCAKHGDFEQTPQNHLSGSGCAKCAGIYNYSTQEWVQEAIAVHSDRYSYDRAVYVHSQNKVIITCKQHGDFEQIPTDHLRGYGCARCSESHRYSTQEWVQKAVAVHGDRYGYDRAAYVRAHDKVIITCTKHGDFEQSPNSHLSGHGCVKCSKESMAAKKTQKAKDSFIERSRAVHGDRYDYSETVYVIHSEDIIITCKIHGDFEQRPHDHLRGRGCAKCGNETIAIKLSQEAKDNFIEKARAVHGDKYDYSKAFYIRGKDKIIITCKIHGDFEQTPSGHLKGNGCPSCPKRFDQPTNLYLMHNGLGKVKVGYTIDSNRRISELNSNAPFEAELLETWTLPDTPTVRKIESKVHRKLAKYHAGLSGFDGATEWFDTSPKVAKAAILKALSGAEVLGHNIADSQQLALL